MFLRPEYAQRLFENEGFKVLEHKVIAKKPWYESTEKPSNSQAYILGIK
jgi:hypothetical protein